MVRKYIYVLAVLLVSINNVNAKSDVKIADVENVSISGTACEAVKEGEAISSVFSRVINKASFAAVENISDFIETKPAMIEKDYNEAIYKIVDNHISSISTKTISQDNESVCMQVSGYVEQKYIDEILSPYKEKVSEEEKEIKEYNDEIEKKETVKVENPEEVKEKSKDELEDLPQSSDVDVSDIDETVDLFKLYVAPTEFYNGTKSPEIANILKELFFVSDDLYLIKKHSEADFVVTSKIDKAKIQPINKKVNRLYMVVSVKAEDKDGKEIIKEFQKKFIAFSKDNNEQEVAYNLAKKLLEAAGEKVLEVVENEIAKAKGKKKKISDIEVLTPPEK